MSRFACTGCGEVYETDLTQVDGVPIQQWWDHVRGRRCKTCIRLGRQQGIQGRDDGMALAVAHTPDSYRVAYAEEFERALWRGEPFCSDDIVRVVGLPPAPASPNAVGGIFNGLLRKNKDRWAEAGYIQMERPGAHARRTRVYRLRPDLAPRRIA